MILFVLAEIPQADTKDGQIWVSTLSPTTNTTTLPTTNNDPILQINTNYTYMDTKNVKGNVSTELGGKFKEINEPGVSDRNKKNPLVFYLVKIP